MTDSTATGGTRLFRFGVVAPLTTDLPTWRDRVRRIADSGYSTLLVPDVPHWQPAPGPTLAVAAALADLRVGTWMYASPLRPPWMMAWPPGASVTKNFALLVSGEITPQPECASEVSQLCCR